MKCVLSPVRDDGGALCKSSPTKLIPYTEISIYTSRVRSFGRIRIRISDLWRSFRANPFSDQ